ncbi:hypothetical protein L917_18828 [Phytophthora nicotianae]|nr:hypothetical protein L917_18828 [Phytophthora nicotianae]
MLFWLPVYTGYDCGAAGSPHRRTGKSGLVCESWKLSFMAAVSYSASRDLDELSSQTPQMEETKPFQMDESSADDDALSATSASLV